MFVAQLQELCLKNVALNFIRHKTKMEKLPKSREISVRYEKLKFLFTQDLLREIEFIHHTRVNKIENELDQFLNFLFCKELESNGNEFLKSCLKLLFNEYTLRFSYDDRSETRISKKLLPIVLSQCKNLITLKLNFYEIWGYRMSNLPFWNTLIQADFLHSGIRDVAMTDILLWCPNLQVFKASAIASTGDFLYNLCEKYRTNEPYDVGKCNGTCYGRKRSLIHLILHESKISVMAAMCALHHFPSLQIFTKNLNYYSSGNDLISTAVSQLRKMPLQDQQAPVSLNLTSVEFINTQTLETIRDVLAGCPRLESFSFTFAPEKATFFSSCAFQCLREIHLEGTVKSHVTSREFNQFLCTQGHLLSSISIDGAPYAELDVSHISHILKQCKRLRRICFRSLRFFSNHLEDYIFDAEGHENNLEEIFFSQPTICHDLSVRFFRNLFSMSPKLRQIGLNSSMMAKRCFLPAMRRNCFTRLEKISFLNVKMESISVMPLIYRNSSLKEILLSACDNAEEFSKIHKDEAIKHNSSLLIFVRKAVASEIIDAYSFLYNK